MAKPITFEAWLLKYYGLSLKSLGYVNDRAKAVLKARYEDYCKSGKQKIIGGEMYDKRI